MDVLINLKNKNPCTRILLSYFKDGESLSEELGEQDMIINFNRLTDLITCGNFFSRSQLEEIIYSAVTALKGKNDDR